MRAASRCSSTPRSGTQLAGRRRTSEARSEPDEGPSPIAPELKELLWSVGAFLVFLVADAPVARPEGEGRGCRPATARSAPSWRRPRRCRTPPRRRSPSTRRSSPPCAPRPGTRIDAARRQLEGERVDRLAEANAAIAERRSQAAAEAEEAAGRGSGQRRGRGGRGRRPDRRAEHRPAPRRRRRAQRRRRAHERGGPIMIGAHRDCSSPPPRGAHRPDPLVDLARGLRAPLRQRWRRSSSSRLLFWKAGPLVKKAMAARTARIQAELDGAASALTEAEAEAARSARPWATSAPSGPACSPRPTRRPRPCSTTGGPGWTPRSPSCTPRPTPTSPRRSSRGSDELRAEIARLASAAADRVVEQTLDAETQQRLIEDFIASRRREERARASAA